MKLDAGIGILSVLIAVAIMLYLFAGPIGPGGTSYGGTVAQKNKEMTAQANQFSGRDPQGKPLSQTLTLEPFPASGTLRGAQVASIDDGGIAQAHFGLQVGDVIEQIGPQDVGGMIIGSLGVAGDFLDDAFARGMQLTVRRDGQTVRLPAADASAAAGGTATPAVPTGTVPPQPNVPRGVPGTPNLPGGLNLPQ